MKNMLITFLLIASCIAAKAQNNECPKITVNAPYNVKQGEFASFTANVRGGDSGIMPAYNWSISNGTISSGQGTSVITVSTEGIETNASITATVEVGGYARSCTTVASFTATVVEGLKSKTKITRKSTKRKVKSK